MPQPFVQQQIQQPEGAQTVGAPPAGVIQQQVGGGTLQAPVPQAPVYQEPVQQEPVQQVPVPQTQVAPQPPQQIPQPAPPSQWDPQYPNTPPASPQFTTPSAQSTPAQPAGDPMMDYLRSVGYDTSGFSSGQQFLETLGPQLQKLQNYDQTQTLAQIGSKHLTDQAGQQQAPQSPDQAEPPIWNPPEYNQEWERFLEVDERTGRYKPYNNDPALMQYAERANQHLDYRRQQAEQLWQNPYEYIWNGIAPKVTGELDKLQKTVQTLQKDLDTRQFWDAIGSYQENLFTKTPDGHLNYDQTTDAGRVFGEAFQASEKWENSGRPLSIEERVQAAWGHAAPHVQQQVPQQQAPAAPNQPNQSPPPAGQQQVPATAPVAPVQQQLPVQPPAQNGQPQNGQHQYVNRLEQSNQSFLDSAIAQVAQNQPPQTQAQHDPNMGGSIVSAAQQQIIQNPSQSWDQYAEETQQQLGVQLD